MNIKAVADGNKLTFDLVDSRYLIVKINELKELAIAADNLETDIPENEGIGIYNILSEPYKADPKGAELSTIAIQTLLMMRIVMVEELFIYRPACIIAVI